MPFNKLEQKQDFSLTQPSMRFAEINGFFSSVRIPQPISSLIASLLSPADFINAHLGNPTIIINFCLSLLNEKDRNDVAYAFNELNELDRNTLLEYIQEKHLLLWAYYSDCKTWTLENQKNIYLALQSESSAKYPSALLHVVKIKLYSFEINGFYKIKELLQQFSPHMHLANFVFPQGKTLRRINLEEANLSAVSFTNVNYLLDVSFQGGDLSHANFEGLVIADINFKNCNLKGANFNNINIDDTSKNSFIQNVLSMELVADDLCFESLKCVKEYEDKESDEFFTYCINLIWLLGATNLEEWQKRFRENCSPLASLVEKQKSSLKFSPACVAL